MNKTALIHPSDVKIELIMFYEVINAKIFRRSIAIAVVVTSPSSSIEYIISLSACMRGKRNVCNIY